ncbi:MAG: GGDEF domain-containing protein [Candidatus Pacearchaeota archaeon]
MDNKLSEILEKITPEFYNEHKEIIEIIKKYNSFIQNNPKKDAENNYVIPAKDIETFNKSMIQILNKINKIHKQLTKDPKTNLCTFKFFEKKYKSEFEKVKDISIIMLDVDFFKKINDTHGHFMGDKVLLELSKTLKKSIRRVDLISRFGGDEFILLVQGDKKSSEIVINRIKKNIKENEFLQKYNLKLSGGIAIKKESDKNLLELKKRADKALYKAKKSGRDNFIFD